MLARVETGLHIPPEAGSLFDTAPPEEAAPLSALQRLKRRVSSRLSPLILPVVKRAARAYVGGETVTEAMCVLERLAGEGFTTTLGYWDTGRDTARQVAGIHLEAMAQLAPRHLGCYLSLKPPALRYAPDLAAALAGVAAAGKLRLHCDSHGPEAADLSNAMLQAMLEKLDGEQLGTTLPGRWARSLRDADWAIERSLNVRVVKGQWPDPADPKRDLADGFLEVIGRLAGRARHVAVATHDFTLASEAIARLRAAGTPCGIEVLLGMPAKKLLRWAKENAVPVRIYVPFGAGFVPNAIGVLRRNPRLVLAVAQDRLSAAAEFIAALTHKR